MLRFNSIMYKPKNYLNFILGFGFYEVMKTIEKACQKIIGQGKKL
jgi:hypothetical protein